MDQQVVGLTELIAEHLAAPEKQEESRP
jgi:hypothetical protein